MSADIETTHLRGLGQLIRGAIRSWYTDVFWAGPCHLGKSVCGQVIENFRKKCIHRIKIVKRFLEIICFKTSYFFFYTFILP